MRARARARGTRRGERADGRPLSGARRAAAAAGCVRRARRSVTIERFPPPARRALPPMRLPTEAALPLPTDDAYRAVELSPPPAAQRAGVRLVRLDFDFDAAHRTRALASLSNAERERARRFVRVE
ncbi:4'-phosphopantetheinyl transferase, partial [Burkholderia pseudomallei]